MGLLLLVTGAASCAYDQGADLRLIMETLGHSQISVTADDDPDDGLGGALVQR